MKKADLEFVIFDTEDVIATSGTISGGGCTQTHYLMSLHIDDDDKRIYYLDLNNNRAYDQGVDFYFNNRPENCYYHADGTKCQETPLFK